MAWKITDDYPFQETAPDLIDVFQKPFPTNVMSQKEDYPYFDLNDISVPMEPYPDFLFLQDNFTNDRYPFLKLPELIEYPMKPLPWIMLKPNIAKEVEIDIPIMICMEVNIPSFI